MTTVDLNWFTEYYRNPFKGVLQLSEVITKILTTRNYVNQNNFSHLLCRKPL